ncbi:transketolase [Malaciobacter molluscorum]|uniref:transketolase n=1 Tax=Malaciobacter molluscorum TaxID=1032072 RepID=UPI00100B07D4|nr:transketolase [Malaciobacter molluscorum]RXJ93838.1 transketolase [Malaciobacter molluscorum]
MLNSQIIRKKTIELSCKTGAGHLAPALSTVEILTVLFNKFLNFNKNNPKDETRDRFILSKGHGCYAYYVILNELGFIPNKELETFNTLDSRLMGCVVENNDFMIEASTGSLGHGLPIAVGMAKSFKLQNKSNKVICMIGDGEMQEGSNFEALMLAYRFKLDNLLIIIDANDLQAMGRVENIALDNNRLAKILNSFIDTNFFDIDGHNEEELEKSFIKFYNQENEKFSIIFARTIKGKGIKLLEHSQDHHYRCPTLDGYELKENDD